MENAAGCQSKKTGLKQAMSTVVPRGGLKYKFLNGANLSLEILEGQKAKVMCTQYS